MFVIWVLLGAIVCLILLSYLLENLRAPVDNLARKGAEGAFADLSQGVTRYRWHGPTRGPVLVAVHGLIAPSVVWDVLAAGFGAMGFRVLTYDLYGRGLSDAPAGLQDRAFFLQQLNDLLEDQGLEDELTFVGYSMGGSIATAFAQENPHRVKRLILLAPAGIETRESGFASFCRKTPVVGDWVHGLLGGLRLKQGIARDTAQSDVPAMKAAVAAQLKRRGFLPAILSSRRGMLDEEQKAAHQVIGRADIPTVAIWAEDDDVVPISALGTLAQWNRNVRQETIAGAGHGMPHTHTEALLIQLRDILIETD